jgi:PAS domain S-box-containing protein
MLQRLSEQVRACHENAADAKQKAETVADPSLKASFLDLEKRWLALARSYSSSESVGELPASMPDRQLRADERARANKSLRLQEISTMLIQEGNLAALYDRVLDAAIALMSADMGSMQTFHPEQDELHLLVSRGFRSQVVSFWERVNRDSATSCGRALAAGRRVIVPDIECSEFMAGSADLNVGRQAGIRAMHSTPLVSRSGQLMGMISTHWREPHHPAERELRSLDVLARQAADLIERTQAEERFRWLASIVESSDDAIVGKNIDGIITSWNNGAERLFGYTAHEVVDKPVTVLFPPDRHDEERTILERIMRGERIEHYETVRRHKDGRLIDVSLTISPVKDAEGKIVGASKIARDITERKRAEAREKMLMAELDHRVKNVLARVAMVMMSSRHASSSIDEFTQSLTGRINAMAAAHALLSKGRWHGVGLDGLVRNQLAPYVTDANITISGPDVMLLPVATQAMAMVLHELVTNAAKYGALSVPSGRVLVNWEHRTNGHAAANLVFVWRELGGPPTAAEVQSGYGTRLIRELVPHDLGGTVDLQLAATGVSCKIELPLMQV